MEQTRSRPQALRIAVSAVLAAAALLVLWKAVEIILLALASVLLAIFLVAVAEGIARITRLPQGWALACAVTLLGGLLAGAVALMWPSVSAQIDQLVDRLPRAWQGVEAWLRQWTWGRWMLERAAPPAQDLSSTSAVGKVFGYLGTTMGLLANLLIAAVLALYLAARPRSYVEGALLLLPPRARPRAREVKAEMSYELRWWLIGQLCGMVLVGVLTWLGLWMIGVPLALALGFLAGLFNFVPNIGPWIAAIPGLMLALSVRPSLAVWAALVYFGAQVIESYVVTPMIHQRNVDMPPALLILAQVLMAVLVGPVAVIMAAPVLVIALVLVKMLYVEDHLGDRAELPGQKNGH